MQDTILILGNGVTANLAAAYLRKALPGARSVIVGRPDEKRPIVGESLVEYSTRFMYEIGAGHLLEERQGPKFGLTFYHKESLKNPACARYFQHETPGHVRMPSFHINRERFDADIEELNRQNGQQYLEGWVQDVELGTNGAPHVVRYKAADGTLQSVTGRWVIDATGRRGVVARKVGVREKWPHQRSTFWLRLKDYDPNVFSKMKMIRPTNHTYDSYNCTHHFFGKGNWLWFIPLASDEPRSLMSVGITYRPDRYGGPMPITTMPKFLDALRLEHPILAEFVESGTVVDTNVYLNYMYVAKKFYSTDRWFLLGDAGITHDPIFSNGLMLSCAQAVQLAAMIKKDIEGPKAEADAYIEALDTIFTKMALLRQTGSSYMYEHMGDPIRCAWYIWVGNNFWFNAALPFLMNGWHTEPSLAEFFGKMMPSEKNALDDLAAHVAERVGGTEGGSSPAAMEVMRNVMSDAINWERWQATGEPPARLLSRVMRVQAKLRMKLARHAEPKIMAKHAAIAAQEMLQSAALGVAGRGPFRNKGAGRPFDFTDKDLDGVGLNPWWTKPRPASYGAGKAKPAPAPVGDVAAAAPEATMPARPADPSASASASARSVSTAAPRS